MLFSEKIKELREEATLSQKELADKLKLSQSAITKLENNLREPTGTTLIAYADYFDVSLDYLVGREDIDRHFVDNPEKRERKALYPLSENEETLVASFRKMSIFGQQSILIQVKALAEEADKEDKKKSKK